MPSVLASLGFLVLGNYTLNLLPLPFGDRKVEDTSVFSVVSSELKILNVM